MDKLAKSIAARKILEAPMLSMEEFKKRMKPGDILFQSRIKNFDAGVVPYLASSAIQLGQRAPMMHAAMVGAGKKILDYGTGGVDYIKGGNSKRGFRKISIKEALSGGRRLAIGRVTGMDKEDRKKATDTFRELASKKKFNAGKSIKVGINRFFNKKILSQRERGEFCSTVVDKAIDQIRIKGIATPADLLEHAKVNIIGVLDPLKKVASLKETNMPFQSNIPKNFSEKTASFFMKQIMSGIDKNAGALKIINESEGSGGNVIPENPVRDTMDIQKEKLSQKPGGPEALLARHSQAAKSSKGGMMKSSSWLSKTAGEKPMAWEVDAKKNTPAAETAGRTMHAGMKARSGFKTATSFAKFIGINADNPESTMVRGARLMGNVNAFKKNPPKNVPPATMDTINAVYKIGNKEMGYMKHQSERLVRKWPLISKTKTKKPSIARDLLGIQGSLGNIKDMTDKYNTTSDIMKRYSTKPHGKSIESTYRSLSGPKKETKATE